MQVITFDEIEQVSGGALSCTEKDQIKGAILGFIAYGPPGFAVGYAVGDIYAGFAC